MKFDTWLIHHDLQAMPGLTRTIEAMGFDGLWTAESGNNPFFPLVLAAEHSQQIRLGTDIAVAFPRSPTILAHLAWDLAKYSNGRFILGLGAQVKAHIERRYGLTWEKPIRRMRETVEALRAIWDSWQNSTRLKYEGEFFNLSLMTPFFSGGPLDVPRPPVYISAINKGMLRLAGQVADGVHSHPFHSVKYLREYAWPYINEGLVENGRGREDFTAVISIFAIPTDGQKAAGVYEKEAKEQLAFYMSTPAYRIVLDMHGWAGLGERLSQLARRGDWAEMPTLMSDEIMDTFAITGKWGELPQLVQARYEAENLIDRINYYIPFVPGEDDEGWRAAIDGFKHE